MTEYEINKAVAIKYLPCEYIFNEELQVVELVNIRNINNFGIDEEVAVTHGVFDPCNNAQQAWEIMLKHNISVTKDGDGYYAFRNLYYSGCGNWHFDAGAYNEKPFVAAMILFLEI